MLVSVPCIASAFTYQIWLGAVCRLSMMLFTCKVLHQQVSECVQAEKYLRGSGLDWTIVR